MNREQQPHKNSFPSGVQRTYPNAGAGPAPPASLGRKLQSGQVNSETKTQSPAPDNSQSCANPTQYPSNRTDLGSLLSTDAAKVAVYYVGQVKVKD